MRRRKKTLRVDRRVFPNWFLTARSERRRVARELRVTGENGLQVRRDLLRVDAAAREDARHVVLRDATEGDAVLALDAEQVRQRLERFTAADRHVARQRFLVAVDEQRRLPARRHLAVLRAAGRAARDTERLVAERAVGRYREDLRSQAGLAVEHLRAPAAGTDVVRHGGRRSERQHRSHYENLLHETPSEDGWSFATTAARF